MFKEAVYANYSEKLSSNLVGFITTATCLNNSGADSVKLLLSSRAMLQIISAPSLDLRNFRLK